MAFLACFYIASGSPAFSQDGAPAPPASVAAENKAWDDGSRIEVRIGLSADDRPDRPLQYVIRRSGEPGGFYEEIGVVEADERDRERGFIQFVAEKNERNEPYFFRVAARRPGGAESEIVQTAEAVYARREWFDGTRFWPAVILALVCGAIVLFIVLARFGLPLNIRKIAGLDVVEEAVGRATETGRACLFVPGIQDMNEIQTIAGLTVLSRVAQVTAEYGSRIEVPTARSLVMTAGRETVQSAFLAAGRPDAYNEENIHYVTDEQFGYVAYLSGWMVREKPAACFYMGAFYAESLILAETGNSIGAIQVAGTAEPSQLPFFVAACDYTLIGEEFYAASAYLSRDPDQLGSLKGQDAGKVIVAVLLIVGCGLATWGTVGDAQWATGAAEYLRDVILK
ncbi:MAG: DUF6754 domain-containing protein [Planctomycetales bacterium]